MKKIKQKAVFDKGDIPALNDLKGKVNDTPVGEHDAGRLRFVKFSGRHIGEHRYRGDLYFEVLPEVDASAAASDAAADAGQAITSYIRGSGEHGKILISDVREGEGSPLADFSLLIEGMEDEHRTSN